MNCYNERKLVKTVNGMTGDVIIDISGGGVTSVNGQTGDVVLTADSIDAVNKQEYNEFKTNQEQKNEELRNNERVLADAVLVLRHDKADKTEIPTKVSDLDNDAGYITGDALEPYNPTENFKTINGETIIGTGDIEIKSGVDPKMVINNHSVKDDVTLNLVTSDSGANIIFSENDFFAPVSFWDTITLDETDIKDANGVKLVDKYINGVSAEFTYDANWTYLSSTLSDIQFDAAPFSDKYLREGYVFLNVTDANWSSFETWINSPDIDRASLCIANFNDDGTKILDSIDLYTLACRYFYESDGNVWRGNVPNRANGISAMKQRMQPNKFSIEIPEKYVNDSKYAGYQLEWLRIDKPELVPILVKREDFATINGQSIVNGGNIEIQGGGDDVTSVNGQTGDVVITADSIGAAESAELETLSQTVEQNKNDQDVVNQTVDTNITNIENKIKDLELYKTPNLTIFGSPNIIEGQMSGFSGSAYAQFPFLVDFGDKTFVINMCITTGDDVTNQQNFVDSEYGLAMAVRDSHFVIAFSFNGQSWYTEMVGNYIVEPNTTYYLQFSFDKEKYILNVSTDKQSYTQDITLWVSWSLYPKQIIIGKDVNDAHVFSGSINLNYCDLIINTEKVWQGMDDVGLGTRLATDLSNIDAAGVSAIKDIVSTEIPDYTSELINDSGFITTDALEPYNPTNNFKTINGNSIIGTGNIEIQGGGKDEIVKLTQAEYDALGDDYDPEMVYIITDAAPNYATKEELDSKADKTEIPTNTSQLVNDSNFATTGQIPLYTGDLINNSGFITSDDIPTIPTNVSQLNNDAGYITSSAVPTNTSQLVNDSNFATTDQIPTLTSQLNNDSGFITSAVFSFDESTGVLNITTL